MGPYLADISCFPRSSTLTTTDTVNALFWEHFSSFLRSPFSTPASCASSLLRSLGLDRGLSSVAVCPSFSSVLCGQGQLAEFMLACQQICKSPSPTSKHTYTQTYIKLLRQRSKSRQSSKSGVVFSFILLSILPPLCFARPTNSQHPYAHMQHAGKHVEVSAPPLSLIIIRPRAIWVKLLSLTRPSDAKRVHNAPPEFPVLRRLNDCPTLIIRNRH